MNEMKERILLVDDTPENLYVLDGLLSTYKKSVAINGKEALKILDSIHKPDLILLDIMMPEMDGYETCRRIKENPTTQDIPIIFMTALSETTDKIKGFQLGAVDYVTKPFEPEELLKRIETHLKIVRLQQELKDHNLLLEQKVDERTAELQESNKNLLIAKEKAEAADKLKSEFLAQISHEIRTPINIMVSYASLLQSDLTPEVDEDLVVGLSSIDKAGKRLVRTMDLIINLSEVQAGSYHPNIEEVDLYLDVLSEISLSFKELAKSRNLSFKMEIETENTQVNADLFSMKQILTQIVENAVTYTEEGGITILLKENENKQLSIEVSDTGVGISNEFLPKIFEPFSQEDSGSTRKFDGSGIGLTLVKEYCKVNNVDIKITSKKGIGTTVCVTF